MSSPSGRGKRRVWGWGVAAGATAVAVVAAVLLTYDYSRPAPPMTDEARAAGAVRLSYPDRGLPPWTEYFALDGEGFAQVGLLNVEPSADGLLVRLVLGGTDGGDWRRVVVAAGGHTDIGGFRVRVLSAYDGKKVKDDAADVVVEPLP